MKALLLTLLFPIVTFAQTAKAPASKPSTTDCPTWNNKQQMNKSDYYQALRHPKSAKAQSTVAPGRVIEAKPVVNVKSEPKRSTVPSFSSGSDPLLEKKKTEETKAIKEPAKVPLTKAVTAKPAEKPKSAIKEKTEKKPSKKKESASNSGKVRTGKKNAEKCPSF